MIPRMTPPYNVCITKTIWIDKWQSEVFDRLYRIVELPFIPFIGLEIQNLNGFNCDPIEHVAWNGETQVFYASTRPETGDEERSAEDIRHWDMTHGGWLSQKKK